MIFMVSERLSPTTFGRTAFIEIKGKSGAASVLAARSAGTALGLPLPIALCQIPHAQESDIPAHLIGRLMNTKETLITVTTFGIHDGLEYVP